jgi:hypothetical protein
MPATADLPSDHYFVLNDSMILALIIPVLLSDTGRYDKVTHSL